jgi:DNA-binding PadR family transcriptional regulator
VSLKIIRSKNGHKIEVVTRKVRVGNIPPERDGYASTEGGREALNSAADQIQEVEDGRVSSMLKSLGFADSEPPRRFASMEEVARRRFKGK